MRKPAEQSLEPRSATRKTSGVAPFSRVDWMLIGIAVVLTYAICLRLGKGRIFWEDEVLGWMMLKDPSWRHMFYSWQHGADGGGAFFYVTGRIWFSIFGASVVSFRLYTATCFNLAFAFIWIVARRYYAVRHVAFAAATTWFLSPALLPHMAEGRFYGLFTASCAAVVLVVVLSFRLDYSKRTICLSAFIATSALVTSHILGFAYSFCFLSAWLLLDLSYRKPRPSLYLSAAAGWLWLVPSYPAIAASAAVGKPHFWITQPHLFDFVLAYTGAGLRTGVILGGLLACVASTYLHRDLRVRYWQPLKERLPILGITSAFLAIPVAFWLEGFLGPPLFSARYLLPVGIGILLLTSELSLQLGWAWKLLNTAKSLPLMVAASLLAAMVLQYDLMYLPIHMDPQANYTSTLTSTLPSNIPVICEDAFTFTELMSRESQSPVRYTYLLDWDNSISAHAPILEVTQYHLMENWKKVGYFPEHISYRDSFLAENSYFLILHTDQHDAASLTRPASSTVRNQLIGNPLTARFANDPAYQELTFGSADYGRLRETTTLVCRQGINCSDILARLKESMHPRSTASTHSLRY